MFGKQSDKSDLTIRKDTRRIIESIAFSWVGPVFFIVLGTRLILDLDIFLSVLDETVAFTGCLLVGQVLSAGLAAKFTGHFN